MWDCCRTLSVLRSVLGLRAVVGRWVGVVGTVGGKNGENRTCLPTQCPLLGRGD